MKYFYSIYHTRTFFSNILEKIIFNWVVTIITYSTANYTLAIILIGTSIYLYLVAYLFIILKLRSDKDTFIFSHNYAEIFDYDLAQHLVGYFPKQLTYSQLIHAVTSSKRGQTILSYMGLVPDTFYTKLKDLQ